MAGLLHALPIDRCSVQLRPQGTVEDVEKLGNLLVNRRFLQNLLLGVRVEREVSRDEEGQINRACQQSEMGAQLKRGNAASIEQSKKALP